MAADTKHVQYLEENEQRHLSALTDAANEYVAASIRAREADPLDEASRELSRHLGRAANAYFRALREYRTAVFMLDARTTGKADSLGADEKAHETGIRLQQEARQRIIRKD